ncbi:putative vacuolar protein sorting-associated protein 70 [Podospora australis]|uniref:Vacuolar protein sorting-associated protein 70 n=1 Tax=Podospora australis TaxID=1536484 RepID=A0AAN6WYE0_9PEZI|nr:putative vacuolar protein sorting-associated protein 70 [Podospora australis]
MASEHEPLIANKAGVTRLVYEYRPPRPQSQSLVRRFCTIALGSTLIWIVLTFVVSMLSDDLTTSQHDRPHGKSKINHDQLKQILLDTPSSQKAEEWSRYYTAGPHLAGKNLSQAVWTKDKWESWGINSLINTYDVYINYPVDHRLALLQRQDGDEDGKEAWEVTYEASLTEDVLEEDPTSGLEDGVPTFHGYSASGNVTAPVVYVNYGTYQDFEDLLGANITLKGKIAIARYGGIFRGLKVKRAQELGMIGVILYSDPGDDGDVTDEKGVAAYPEGPARQPSSVQRGSTQFLSVAPGDPTTPGYPSKPGVPRQPVHTAIPSIPSIPISYTDALPILKALNGHGPKAEDFNQWWTRSTGLQYKGVHYNIGPTPDDVVVNLYNEQDYVTTPLWNVIGIINGTIPDEVIVVGNHRDAWVAGGAGDPNSGSAVFNEVIRSFGQALELGWKPLRTIVLASWDGEEYGLVGSTEWVEEYLPWLSNANVAYVNTDVGVRGKRLSCSAAPLLHDLIYSATAAVASPNQTTEGQSVYDVWDKRISTMGSGSDFTAFQDFAGIPSVDIGFNSDRESAVYHYHSNYDSFHWMEKYGDPGFVYHRTMAQVLGLIVAQLSDLPVIPFGAEDYTNALGEYVNKVEDKLDAALSPQTILSAMEIDNEAMFDMRASHRNTSTLSTNSHSDKHPPAAALKFKTSLKRLHKALQDLKEQAVELDTRASDLSRTVKEHIPWWKWLTKLKLYRQIRKVNTKYKFLERSFLYEEGLDGRSWFKHVVFAPGLWTGYSGAVFPGLVESIDSEDWTNAQRWVDIIESRIYNAARKLE